MEMTMIKIKNIKDGIKKTKFQFWIIYFLLIFSGTLFGNDIFDWDKINQRYYTSILDSSFVGKTDDETIQIFNEYTDGLTISEYLTFMYEVAERDDMKSAYMTLYFQLEKKYEDELFEPLILLDLVSDDNLNSDFRDVLIEFLREICKGELEYADQVASTMLSIAINEDEIERIRRNAFGVLQSENLIKIIQDNSNSQDMIVKLTINPNTPAILSHRAIKFLKFISPNKLDSYSTNVLDNYLDYQNHEIQNAIEHFRNRDELLKHLGVFKYLGRSENDKVLRHYCLTVLGDIGSIEAVIQMVNIDKSEIREAHIIVIFLS